MTEQDFKTLSTNLQSLLMSPYTDETVNYLKQVLHYTDRHRFAAAQILLGQLSCSADKNAETASIIISRIINVVEIINNRTISLPDSLTTVSDFLDYIDNLSSASLINNSKVKQTYKTIFDKPIVMGNVTFTDYLTIDDNFNITRVM